MMGSAGDFIEDMIGCALPLVCVSYELYSKQWSFKGLRARGRQAYIDVETITHLRHDAVMIGALATSRADDNQGYNLGLCRRHYESVHASGICTSNEFPKGSVDSKTEPQPDGAMHPNGPGPWP